MFINIHDYVDRYLNSYVHYHWQSFEDNADAAGYLFSGKYQEAIDTMTAATFGGQLQASQFNNADKASAAEALDVADQIANGTLLQETLDDIAAQVNSAIEARSVNIEYEKLYEAALSYQNMMESGTVQYSTVHSFLQLLTYVLDQSGGYNAQFLSELRWFGKTITGRKKFNFNPGNARAVSQDQLANLTKIQNALIRSAEKFKQSGQTLSAASFRQTIAYIFNKGIKDQIALNLFKSAFEEGDIKVDNILVSLGFKPEQPLPRKTNVTQQTNIINTNGLQLQIAQNGTTATIEIGTNLQVHWIDTIGGSKSINILSRTTMGELFAAGTPNRYYAYNLMAHRDQFQEQYNIMRAATAASFVRDSVMSVNKQQVSQFLMINGRVYPILTIIKNICDEYMRNSAQGQIGITIQEPATGSNRWQVNEHTRGPSVELALIRSQLINNIIDKLTIQLHYNSNILSNYIK